MGGGGEEFGGRGFLCSSPSIVSHGSLLMLIISHITRRQAILLLGATFPGMSATSYLEEAVPFGMLLQRLHHGCSCEHRKDGGGSQ